MTDKVETASKVCESKCPNCGADESHCDWDAMVHEDVTYRPGTCRLCGCVFKEYLEYSDTEWNVSEKEIKTLQHRIEVKVLGYDIEIELGEQDGTGKWQCGTITTNLHEPDYVLPKDPEPSDLAEAKEEQESIDAYNHMMDGIESFLLCLARHNVDINSPVFHSALQETFESCGNNA